MKGGWRLVGALALAGAAVGAIGLMAAAGWLIGDALAELRSEHAAKGMA